MNERCDGRGLLSAGTEQASVGGFPNGKSKTGAVRAGPADVIVEITEALHPLRRLFSEFEGKVVVVVVASCFSVAVRTNARWKAAPMRLLDWLS